MVPPESVLGCRTSGTTLFHASRNVPLIEFVQHWFSFFSVNRPSVIGPACDVHFYTYLHNKIKKPKLLNVKCHITYTSYF